MSIIQKKLKDKLDDNFKGILKGSVIAFLIKMLGAIINFTANIVLARFLGAEGAGVYFLALTLSTAASVIGRMGLDNTMLRYISSSKAENNLGKLMSVYRKSMFISLTVSTVVAILILVTSQFIGTIIFNDPSLVIPLKIMALSVIPFALLNLHAEALKAIGKISKAIFVQGLGVPLLFLSFMFVFYKENSVESVAIAYVLSTVFILLIGYLFWTNSIKANKGYKSDNFETNVILATSLPLLWVSLMNLVMNIADTVMLGMFSDSKDVGIYGVVLRITMISSMLLIAINSVVGPKFSELWTKGELSKLTKLSQLSTFIMLLIAISFLTPFLIIPEFILSLFGEEFIQGTLALIILAIGQFVVLATGPVAYLLMMTGHEKFHRNNVVLCGILNIILNFVLIPNYGLPGAAVATATSLILKNILAVIFVKLKLKIALFKYF
ncbi:flippase [Salirhabdus salicampi]|uniref:flippase n=1 Tax=Salirhabdus salicampi TaxID=476102 RepID=UPI0020C4BAF6|nr:flippase [Salirhabdus salicampi]MCP8617502.1 flippase [Salirhabdus salicampi]